eukprot:TRINITY_DN3339_c0_g1_i3.p3 TRINITY_DN3339_c0_g1~~TRINITY_DN3339_c0_g1_i3.p3  ORF type:complete len:118 (+),score=6.07 TRINITY_DN3339_c0_g1_i3:187-540(+)
MHECEYGLDQVIQCMSFNNDEVNGFAYFFKETVILWCIVLFGILPLHVLNYQNLLIGLSIGFYLGLMGVNLVIVESVEQSKFGVISQIQHMDFQDDLFQLTTNVAIWVKSNNLFGHD